MRRGLAGVRPGAALAAAFEGAAAALAAPMLLRSALARMDETDGPDWKPVRCLY